MTPPSTVIHEQKDLYSFNLLGEKIHFKLHSGVFYLLFKDITFLLELDYGNYLGKIDNTVELKYPTVIFEKNYEQVFVSISTLMRFLSDLNSALGHFKGDNQKLYKINQLYQAFK